MPITVLLADDHQMMREGLKALLEQDKSIRVVAEAANGREALEKAGALAPRVAIIDVSMPELNGIVATRRILHEQPACKIIALSTHADRVYVLEMFKAGASAYVLKESTYGELCRAITAVLAGQKYVSPSIAGIFIDEVLAPTQAHTSCSALLTSREREVLQMIAEGHTSKEIALALSISLKTVESHRQQLMDKLKLHTIADLTKYAIRAGLTAL